MDNKIVQTPIAGPIMHIAREPVAEPIAEQVRRCEVCGAALAHADARKCNTCKSFQGGTKCRNCGFAMAPGSVLCSECKSHQNWRRWIPDGQIWLAIAVTAMSLLTGLVPRLYDAWNYRSRTIVRVLGLKEVSAEDYHVLAEVLNTGGQSSVVRRAWLTFPGLHVMQRLARIENPEKTVVLPNQPTTLNLSVAKLERTGGATKEQIMASLESGQVRVVVELDETRRDGTQLTATREDACRASTMKGLFDRYVPKN
jgi:hypothetical protein